MARKCFISFKTEDTAFKTFIQQHLDLNMIDKSLDIPINSIDEDYIMRMIRENYLSDSTVTIHLIGANSSENKGVYEQRFIKRELQASLYNGDGNSRNGILGVVLPAIYNFVYNGTSTCMTCGSSHTIVNISDSTTIKEFSYNYYIPCNKCAWSDDDKYCVLVKWDDFIVNPEFYIEQAYIKRSQPIANKVKVYP